MNDSHDNAPDDAGLYHDVIHRPGGEARPARTAPRPEALTNAITLPQPLAWACCGPCPVICSDTRPDIARIGELIGIHASRHWIGLDEAKALEPKLERKVTGDEVMAMQRRGALVGVARLKGVVRHWLYTHPVCRDTFALTHGRWNGASDWLPDEETARLMPWWRPGTKWGLLLDEAVALSEPIPMRGAGGLWRLPEEVHDGRNWGKDGNGLGPIARRTLEQWRKGRAAR